MTYTCNGCARTSPVDALLWRCDHCGGVLDLAPALPFDSRSVDTSEPGLWRYAHALPSVPPAARISLGEIITPLVETPRLGDGLRLKVDYLFPSGSYKDRGSAVMVSRLAASGASWIMDDSSGNAGASIAAYAAAAGLRCSILAPASASAAKLAQISAHGATLERIAGDRAAVAAAARDAAARDGGPFYASHIYQPLFIAGCSTVGFEIWEQSQHDAPTAIIAAVGYGSQLLGLHRAYASLTASRAARAWPRLFAVQAAAFPALTRAFDSGAGDTTAAQDGATAAEGIACRQPARGPALLRALRESSGAAIAVTDLEIASALRRLADAGYFVEPTGAVAYAGYRALVARGVLAPGARAIVILSGSGLKAGSDVADLVAADRRQPPRG